MEKTFETKFGNVSLRGAMIDTDGTNLCEGIEIKKGGKFITEVLGVYFSQIEDYTQEEIESFLEKHCDPRDL